jgi:zinc transporter
VARALLTDSDTHLQLDYVEQTVIGVIADLHYDEHATRAAVGHLRFAIGDRVLVSARVHALRSVEATRQAISRGRRMRDAIELLEAIVEHFADVMSEVTAHVAEQLNEIEDRVLDDVPHDERERLAPLRRLAVRTHRQLRTLRALFVRVERPGPIPFPEPLVASSRRLAQRLESLAHELESVQERARLLQDEVAAKLAHETNRHLYALSVITALLLPPTLITGIFGMNTGGLPLTKDDSGFLIAMGLAIFASVLAFWILRRLGVAAGGLKSRRE